MDLGSRVSYMALDVGAPVYSSDNTQVGKVSHVLADPREDLFEGIVINEHLGRHGHRFVDEDEIDSIYEQGVVLKLDAVGCEGLPEPTANPAVIRVDPAESESEFRHDKLHRAWDLISGKHID
jgi:uncharacterized protein YrrD